MRKLWIAFAIGLLAVGTAGVSQAGTLAYNGTVLLEIGTLPPIPVSGSGVATVNGSGGGTHLSDLHIDSGVQTQNTIIVPITDPEVAAAGIVSLRATKITVQGSFPVSFLHLGGSTDVVTDAGGDGGVIPVGGTVLVCLITKGCGSNLVVPLTTNTTAGVGIGGGVLTVNGFAQTGLRLSVQGNPWTVNTAVITGIPTANGNDFVTSTRKGFVHGPGSNTSSTALPSGVVQLVTPIVVELTGAPVDSPLALFGTLRLHFIPEPGTLLLLGSGVAGLALLGRRRMQK